MTCDDIVSAVRTTWLNCDWLKTFTIIVNVLESVNTQKELLIYHAAASVIRLSLGVLVSRVETRMTSCKLHDILFTLMVLFIRLSDEAEMHLKGSSYIKFDMINTQSGTKPATSETLYLQFKTFHPNGLLFYAHGTTGQYISLELAEGKLR